MRDGVRERLLNEGIDSFIVHRSNKVMAKLLPAENLPVGRTMRAAHQAARTLPNDEVVKARELVEARFARGSSPSAAARKMLALLIQAAAGDAWEPGPHSVFKRNLRGSHNSNDRLSDAFDELQGTLLRIGTIAPDGRAAALVAPVVAYRIEHLEEDDKTRVWWEFSEPARRAMQGSDHYAAMNRAALLAFESRYSVTLYERGALLVGRRDARWRGTVEELREVLGIPSGRYQPWADIRRFVLDLACAEVNQLADFACGWKVEQGPRNKVLAVELWFRPKDQTGRMAAARELDETRDGRKARRDGQATPTRLQPDLVEALAALRDGRLPPSTAE